MKILLEVLKTFLYPCQYNFLPLRTSINLAFHFAGKSESYQSHHQNQVYGTNVVVTVHTSRVRFKISRHYLKVESKKIVISLNYIHQTHSKLKYAKKYDCSTHEASCIMFQPPLLLLANIVHNSDSFLNTSRKLLEHKKNPLPFSIFLFLPTLHCQFFFLLLTVHSRQEWKLEQ